MGLSGARSIYWANMQHINHLAITYLTHTSRVPLTDGIVGLDRLTLLVALQETILLRRQGDLFGCGRSPGNSWEDALQPL